MSPSLGLHSLRDQRRPLLVWAPGLLAVIAMYAAIFPSIRGNVAYRRLLDSLPASIRSLVAATAGDITTGAGYLNVELLSLMGPLLVLAYAINAGARGIAGEAEAGTLDLLLTTPLSRRRLLLDKALGLGGGLTVLMLVASAGVLVAGALTRMSLKSTGVLAAVVHLGLLGLVYGVLALTVGAATGRVSRARGVALVLAVVGYLVNGLTPLASWLRPFQALSPFHQYLGHDPLRHGISAPSIAIALGTVGALLLAGVVAFERRDISR
jgi:ABC-2 type transport system permease protein